MDDYSDWNFLFSKSWCPVFGDIPGDHFYREEGEPLSKDPLDKLALIIKEARELLDILGGPHFDSEWPSIEEIEEQKDDPFCPPIDQIELYRQIYSSYRCIKQYSIDFRTASFSRGSYTEQILFGADCCNIKASPFEILAVLSIREAFNQAKELVIHQNIPDPSTAFYFLWEAQRVLDAQELEDAETEINQLIPLAEKEIRAQENRSQGGKVRALQNEDKKCLWQNLATDFWSRRPDHSIRSVAALIVKETGDPFETIRKNIKKP